MSQFQNDYFLVEEGTLNEETLFAINNTLTTIRGTTGFDLYWSLRRDFFNPEYQAFVERLMCKSERPPNSSY